MFICQDGATAAPSTPSGWTHVAAIGTLSGPDGGHYDLFYKTAVCTGSETTVAVTMGSGIQTGLIVILTYSGRSSATPTFTGAGTLNTTANNPSGAGFSLSTGGGTAAAGDDVTLFAGFDPTAGTAGLYTLGSVTAGFAKADESSTAWLSSAAWVSPSVAAGATGSITATVTGGATITAGYAAITIAFPGSAVAVSDVSESAGTRQLRTNAIYRMSPRSEREAQQFLRAQKRAYGFAGAA